MNHRNIACLLLGAAACASGVDDDTTLASTDPKRAASANEPGGAAAGSKTASNEGGPVLEHLLITGQSNSVGYNAHDVVSHAQPFENVMFDVGVMTAARCDADGCLDFQTPKSLVPLVEGDTYDGGPVETLGSGWANQLTSLRGGVDKAPQLLVSDHGRSGMTYACIRKGGCDFYTKPYVQAFDDGTRQVQAAKALASARGLRYMIRAVALIHGESDHYAPPFPILATDGSGRVVENYAEALVELQKDYDEMARAATGQTTPVPLLVSQMNNWNDRPDSEIPGAQLAAHEAAPGKVVLIGPTYALPFTNDCIHFTGVGERRLGEYFAKVTSKIASGETWEPVRPTAASLSGHSIVVHYLVPVPPLVLDRETVADPGNAGFELSDGTAIEDVAATGPDTITLTLANPPSAGAHLRYAMRAVPNTCPGPMTGPRGNVRDSDTTKSLTGTGLEDWSVAFDIAVQ